MITVKLESGNRIDYEGLNLTVSKLIDMLNRCKGNAEVNVVTADGREYNIEVTEFSSRTDSTVIINGIEGNYMTVADLISDLGNYDPDESVNAKIINNRIRTITHIWNEGSVVFLMCDI